MRITIIFLLLTVFLAACGVTGQAPGPTTPFLPEEAAAALHAAGGGPGPDLRYGLFRTDAATGAETALLEADPEGDVPLATGPRQLADGRLYAFVELAPAQDVTWERPFRPMLSRVGPDGSVTPLTPPVAAPAEVLWAEDGAGAVIMAFAAEYGRDGQLFWQPADGRPATLIPFVGGDTAWVPANGTFASGDCAAFSPLSYRAGAGRQPDPAVYDLQGRLRPLGFDAGAPDGLYGEQTRAAVEAFQRSRALPATGEVDCATWQSMLAQR